MVPNYVLSVLHVPNLDGRMPGRHLWASGALLATALVTSVLLVAPRGSWHPTTAVVLAASLVIWAAVAVVAILLENSRLGYFLGLFALLISAVIAVLQPISLLWWAVVALLAIAALLFSDTSLGGWVRQRTSAAPVPTRAVLLALLLLTIPGLTALTLSDAEPRRLLVLTGIDLLLLLAYIRRPAFALAAVRVLPIALAFAGWWLPSPGRWVWITGQLGALALAWTKEVRLAVRPLIERGSRVMIPPELAPDEIRKMMGPG